MNHWLAAALAALVFMSPPARADAPTPCEALANASEVFVGVLAEVSQIELPDDGPPGKRSRAMPRPATLGVFRVERAPALALLSRCPLRSVRPLRPLRFKRTRAEGGSSPDEACVIVKGHDHDRSFAPRPRRPTPPPSSAATPA